MNLILDTNIYRNLVRNLSDDEILATSNTIKDKCNRDDITLSFPISSAMELISHFNDENPTEQQECKSALKLLVNLSTTCSSGDIKVSYIPPLNAVLEKYFFETKGKYAEMYEKVIKLAQILVGNIIGYEPLEISKHTETVKNQLKSDKKEIRDNYEAYLRSINDGDADWEYFKDKKKLRNDYYNSLKSGRLSFLVAESFVDRAHNITEKIIIKDQDYIDKIIKFMRDFCPALLMNERLLENVGNSVKAIADITDKRWNTIIDISIILGALYNPNNIDRRLVTEEKNIHSSFESCGFQNKIMNLGEFKSLMAI